MKRFAFFILSVVFSLTSACVRQADLDTESVEILSSGYFVKKKTNNIPDVFYVDTHGYSQGSLLDARIENVLRKFGYGVINNPSQAGYILELTVLHLGESNVDLLRQCVENGYGTVVQDLGDGLIALLVDVLLVQRQVPTASKPKITDLKNISDHNAVAASQMRFGLLTRQKNNPISDKNREILFELLAQEIGKSINNAQQKRKER